MGAGAIPVFGKKQTPARAGVWAPEGGYFIGGPFRLDRTVQRQSPANIAAATPVTAQRRGLAPPNRRVHPSSRVVQPKMAKMTKASRLRNPSGVLL